MARGGYNVTVRIQRGPSAVVTTTYNFPVANPPATLRVGFAASTGGGTNFHEIRNLAIVQTPIAADDRAQTRYQVPVTINVLANDKAFGTTLNPATVNLDPSSTAIATSFLVPGKGTFAVDANGLVTFTPDPSFAGVVSIPYTVNDLLGNTSNPASITVTVTGADVATNVSGPASANPGSQVTYTVNTTNLGVETATNLSPTLLLPPNSPIPASSAYTYNPSSGLVTFNPVTLAQNGFTTNSVTFNVPITGPSSITATSNYTYAPNAVVPDPVAGNNSASLTTAITGLATVSTDCATPGKDGPGSLSSVAGPNTYYPGVAVSTTNGVSTVTVGNPTPAGATLLAANDLVLVMQMQGASITTTPTASTYGAVSSSTAGQYEYATVASVTGATITLTKLLTKTYSTTTSAPAQNFQLIRVPQYSSLTVTGVVTGAAWDSQAKTGGVLALDVAGVTTFTGTTPGLSMSARGFSGGGGVSYGGPAVANTTLYATLTSLLAHGSKGEGIAGTPRFYYDGTAVATTSVEGYATGDNNIGAPASAGGGAQDFIPFSNSGNSGGGGGANLSAGGIGGFGATSNSTGNQAVGGRGLTTGGATTLLMGGGGGAGSTNGVNNTAALNSSGGIGGGVIILRTGTVAGTATLQVNGGNAPSTAAGALTQGGGGGGAAGTMLVLAAPVAGSSTLSTVTASATGGTGGTVNNGVSQGVSYGPGGGGSGGVLYSSSAFSGATALTGGANGTTTDGKKNNVGAIPFGATAGAAGTSNAGITPTNTTTIGGAGSCIPALSVALSTATPNVTRSNGIPNPATYTALVSNTGGTAQTTSTALTLDPLFTATTSAPVLTLTSAGGTKTTLPATAYSVSGAGTSTPSFNGITIPSGATLSITFPASIAASAVNGTVYQAASAVTFLDPTRTTTSGTATPGGNFAGGGTVPGTNYAMGSNALANVTIVAPLPVELTRFEVAAQRQDAVLTWATASEKNNDHFVVERSVNGRDFTAIGTVRGQGNSTRSVDYRFTDAGAGHLASGQMYYRLQQVDTDGTPTYSPVRAVAFAASVKAMAALYPNPSQDEATIDLSGLAQGTYTVTVLDLAGRVLRTQQLGALASPLDLKGLSMGAYIVLVKGVGISQALPLIRN